MGCVNASYICSLGISEITREVPHGFLLHCCIVLWGSLEDGVSGCDLSCRTICQKCFNEVTVPTRRSLKWVSGLSSLMEWEVQLSSLQCCESLPSGKVDHSIFCGLVRVFLREQQPFQKDLMTLHTGLRKDRPGHALSHNWCLPIPSTKTFASLTIFMQILRKWTTWVCGS